MVWRLLCVLIKSLRLKRIGHPNDLYVLPGSDNLPKKIVLKKQMLRRLIIRKGISRSNGTLYLLMKWYGSNFIQD